MLLDRHLHDLDADEVLQIIRGRHPDIVVRLVDSDLESPPTAGASETLFLTPPVPRASAPDLGEDEPLLDGAISVTDRKRFADKKNTAVEPLPGMMGDGPGLEQIYRLARLVSPRQTTVLITGETGTGKELVARGIHQISPRARSRLWW